MFSLRFSPYLWCTSILPWNTLFCFLNAALYTVCAFNLKFHDFLLFLKIISHDFFKYCFSPSHYFSFIAMIRYVSEPSQSTFPVCLLQLFHIYLFVFLSCVLSEFLRTVFQFTNSLFNYDQCSVYPILFYLLVSRYLNSLLFHSSWTPVHLFLLENLASSHGKLYLSIKYELHKNVYLNL